MCVWGVHVLFVCLMRLCVVPVYCVSKDHVACVCARECVCMWLEVRATVL